MTFLSLSVRATVLIAAVPVILAASAPNIYVDNEPITLTEKEQQGLVATLTVLLFILMALDFTGPEVLFLIALMIVCLTQILSLSDTLSGKS